MVAFERFTVAGWDVSTACPTGRSGRAPFGADRPLPPPSPVQTPMRMGPPRLKIDLDRERLADFCRRWRITEFALFGSVLREDFRPDSDLDVLVSFEPDAPWSLWDLSTMRHELEEIFGREVDLVEKKALRNPFRRHAILTSKQVIYAA